MGHPSIASRERLFILELHDADSVRQFSIITYHVFGDPKIVAPNHAPDGQALIRNQAPGCADGESPTDTPARLRVLQHGHHRDRTHPQHPRRRQRMRPSAGPVRLGCLDLPSFCPHCERLRHGDQNLIGARCGNRLFAANSCAFLGDRAFH